MQSNDTIFTATAACTVTGILWRLRGRESTANVCTGHWIISRVRQGNVAPNIVHTHLSTMAAPETNVLAAGTWNGASDITYTAIWEDSTKTMRKMMAGDSIVFSTHEASNDVTMVISGFIQWFCMF